VINSVENEGVFAKMENGKAFRICGVVSNVVKKITKKTNLPWIALTVSGKDNAFNVNVFSDVLESSPGVFEEGNVVVLEGVVRRSAGRDDVRLNVLRARLLDGALAGLISEYFWMIYPDERGEAFMKLLGDYIHTYEGSATLKIGFHLGDGYAVEGVAHHALKCYFPPKVFRELRNHDGVWGVEVGIKEVKGTPENFLFRRKEMGFQTFQRKE
jgi:hypothetical protein